MTAQVEAIETEYKPSSALHPVTIGELVSMELPERQRFLPWLVEGGLVMVFGPRGVGKTYFSIGLAAALTCQTQFMKWDVEKPAGVLLVDGEMSLGDLRSRIVEMLPGEPVAPLEIVSHEIVFEREEKDLNLGLPEWQDAIGTYLEDHPDIRVVIIDNLSCLLPGVAEDKRDEWANKVLPFLLGMRRRGIAVVMLHHSGKGGDQRGTSSREDQLNTVIKLVQPPAYDATKGAQFVVSFTKSRNAFGDEIKDFEVELINNDTGGLTWAWRDVEQSNEDRLLQLARDGVEHVNDAAEELGISKGQVSKLKKRLQAKGMLEQGRDLKPVVPQ